MVDIAKYKRMFLEESRQQLAEMIKACLSLEKDPSDISIIDSLFRAAHSLKGMAASVSYTGISALSHKLEDLLACIRRGDIRVGDDTVKCIMDGIDHLEKMVDAVEDGINEPIDYSELVNRFNSVCMDIENKNLLEERRYDLAQKDLAVLMESKISIYMIELKFFLGCATPHKAACLIINHMEKIGKVEKVSPKMEDIKKGNIARNMFFILSTDKDKCLIEKRLSSGYQIEHIKIERLIVIKARRSGEKGRLLLIPERKKGSDISNESSKISYRKPKTAHVETYLLDNLVSLTGELLIATGRLEEMGKGIISRKFKDGLLHLDNISRELYLQAMNLRMMPISYITDMLPRFIRDIEKKTGKEIELYVDGKEIEMDRAVLEKLGDPFIHLIRNCGDHGIEPSEERRALNKPRKGRISIDAEKENDMVKITIEDDGKGFDLEKIKKVAIKSSIISENELKHMDNDDLFFLVFKPGFSTKDKVTDISGRGVGMDVVKNKIELLGGSILLYSEKGKGTRFTLRLPLTIAVIKVFLFKVKDYTFAVPMNRTISVQDIYTQDIIYDQLGKHHILKEGERIPLFDLSKCLNLKGHLEGARQGAISILIVRHKNKKAALIVDELIKAQDVVVKPIGKPLEGLKIFSGVSVIGDGNTVFLLDVENI